VHVVAPEARPLERALGPELGALIRQIHEEHGVVFHLGRTAVSVDAQRVHLADGSTIEADLVVIGVGVRPCVALAEAAGLALDRGVLVDEWLEASVPGVFAAGDIARYPDRIGGDRARVEHWVVAGRQGQVVARNMLGAREPYTAVPFFWSQHYDQTVAYVGHADRWDHAEIDGNLDARDAAVRYVRGDRVLAVATIGRDRENLEAEVMLEQDSGVEREEGRVLTERA
jgi:NADPH-dependent 2,4-dienoyl-CoA reductase/sulfur reductase-like enzyme